MKVKKIPGSVPVTPPGIKCVVRGWGTTQVNVQEASNILREAEVTVMDKELCNCYYNNKPVITEDMLCARNKQEHSDACWVCFFTYTDQCSHYYYYFYDIFVILIITAIIVIIVISSINNNNICYV